MAEFNKWYKRKKDGEFIFVSSIYISQSLYMGWRFFPPGNYFEDQLMKTPEEWDNKRVKLEWPKLNSEQKRKMIADILMEI
jgi:hypothetical protein